MGNGYIRTSQTRRDNKRKSKEYIYNYVDRVRYAESSFPDYKCPSRGSGWRHNKSISHLDLATSCHSAAAGLNHWSSSHQTRHHQLRHSRSLDYNHIDRCKDALDIAEYYWRAEPEPEVYDEEDEEIIEAEHNASQQQQQQQQQQLKYVSEHHLTQHYRDFKSADENYHHSTNNIYQSSQQLQHQQQQQQQQLQQPQQHQQTRQQNLQHQSNISIPTQPLEFASDSCSLRRSRSLAVIREETFSDLQISSSNGSRRSQLIPRARLVNRGYFRERERLICGSNKHHHHHHTSREKLTTNCNCNTSGCNTASGGVGGQVNACYCQELDEQSTESIADTCDSHQQQLLHHKQQQQQLLHYHPHYHESQVAVGAGTTNDYYEHLKRLDKLALGLVTEQLHPWHNDKSDLESLNSDYFKNSLHQSNDFKQHQNHSTQPSHQHPQQQQQQPQQQLEFEAFEQAVHLLAQEKPRIYQSRRQKRFSALEKPCKPSNSAPVSGGESCPENSQSSVFPETTTSNSDDQTDSASLSEQEYDITKIEEIFQKTQIEGDEESYEIISLTTTRTRIETTEDEAEEREEDKDRLLEEQINGHIFPRESGAFPKEDVEEEEEVEDTEESNRHTTTDTEIEGTLKRARAVSDNLQKIIAYDSVYLSSEESSDSTLIDVDTCDTSLEVASLCTCIDEVETLLHISIEDAIYEPQPKQHKFEENYKSQDSLLTQPQTVSFVETVNTKIEILDHCNDLSVEDIKPIYTQILKIEHTPCTNTSQQQHTATLPAGVTSSAASKPKILSVVEKRKLKRYSDSAYSSNVSDSSEKAITSPTTDSSSASSYTLTSHLKRQVAEPLYIPLKTNLSDNQYHSLPDVNIGQSLKVSESIDAQLRSSYNLDNCCSLDDAVSDCDLQHETETTSALTIEKHNTCDGTSSNNKNNSCQPPDEIVTTEEIYNSIKRFGKAHQKFNSTETVESEGLQTERECRSLEYSSLIEADQDRFKNTHSGSLEDFKTEDHRPISESTDSTSCIESNSQQQSYVSPQPSELNSPLQNYDDSLEKSKDAPGIETENFSQQIERRAKEIRASGRRTQLQQIEFANRAKFRLENTLSQYEDIQKETKEIKCNKSQTQSGKNSLFRIVVTDAQNNIIEEDSIGSLEVKTQEEKENFNVNSIKRKPNRIENADEFLMVHFSKERLKDRPTNTGSRSSGSLKRVPSKHRRQQYPATAAAERGSSHYFGTAEKVKKTLLSPKSKERRVLSNQIYRARPVKVITTTTTTSTTTTTDSFRRNKVKHQSNKMSRPQILQVIDNKRKLENGSTTTGIPTATTAFNTNQIFHNNEELNQPENEYLKKVDAVRCYWSKLVNNDLEQQTLQQQESNEATEEKNKQQERQNEGESLNEQQQQPSEHKEKMSYAKETKKNERENLNAPQQQTQHLHRREQRYEEKKQFILGAHPSPDEVHREHPLKNTTATPRDNQSSQHQDEYSSFMPSIEIVELDGDKTATIVSAAPSNLSSLGGNEANDADTSDANEPQFDHIRYKILKSQQLLRSNVLARNRKEAQFDGLIQYLQEYSFQELLSNNNVVIVEPVRTKIERPITTTATNNGSLSKNLCTTKSSQKAKSEGKQKPENKNSNVHGGNGSNGSGSGIKRHFFYQPVRVNRELYEEELPNPDTVRNVRKFFEEHILPTPGQGLLTKANQQQQATGEVKAPTKQTSPRSRRARKYRYLTIDTSYGHAAAQAAKQTTQRKWDTASLSSGISSGDLSSPCDYNDTENNSKQTTKINNSNSQNDIVDSEANTAASKAEDATNSIRVQELVRKHNGSNNSDRKTRSSAIGVPVRSSGIRPRSAIYGSLHKIGKSSNYRDIYEYHIKHAHHDSDDHEAVDDGDGDDDDNDLFGDVDDNFDELCDTYYVSNDILRKIRECGSSVTYYGGRVVQTSTSKQATGNPLELSGCGNNGHNFNKRVPPNNATKTSLKSPTMMTQTQTRARVREIETCCNAAASADTVVCAMKSTLNECQLHEKPLEQKKFRSINTNNAANNESKTTANQNESNQINVEHNVQEYKGFNKAYHNEGVGITFKLVKSNSCSSRLELAGATDCEPEESEVVRKMVHHFEATKTKSDGSDSTARTVSKGTTSADATLTINNQTTAFCQNVKAENHSHKVSGELSSHWAAVPAAAARIKEGLQTVKNNYECDTKLVTVNNHINISRENLIQATAAAPTIISKGKEEFDSGQDIFKKTEEQKMYQSEAKDIHLDNNAKGPRKEGGNVVAAKVCRNKNVDLAFTFIKQQPIKSPGTNPEVTKNITLIGKQSTSNTNNSLKEEQDGVSKKILTYENTLLPTITATTKIKNPSEMSTGDLNIDESQIQSNSHTNTKTTNQTSIASTLQTKPSQIIVPVQIHRAENNIKTIEKSTSLNALGSKSTAEEKSFLPLSTTSSVSSLIDKTVVVKHYVANDKSIYEKRKYDDIEFEEFEVYDPTKDFEKLIEEEQKRQNPESNFSNNNYDIQHQQQQKQQNSTTSSLSSNTSKASATSSMATANSQQTIVSTETETDCYDSLDDKL